MAFEVVLHSSREPVPAEVLLEHAHDRRALLVGQHVVHALGVSGGDHLVLDGSGGAQRIHIERGSPLDRERVPALPLGSEGIGGGHLHEGGKSFLQPDAVPPVHGDEIAEPHVRQLVRHDVHDAQQIGGGGLLRVGKQQRFPKGDGTHVLHRAEREVGHGNEVDLGAGVGNAVVVDQPGERERSGFQAEPGQRRLAAYVNDPQRHAADVDRLGGFEVADDERHQVGRHLHRVGERVAAAAVGQDL